MKTILIIILTGGLAIAGFVYGSRPITADTSFVKKIESVETVDSEDPNLGFEKIPFPKTYEKNHNQTIVYDDSDINQNPRGMDGKEINHLPTEVTTPKDDLNPELFRVGEKITCIYTGVFSWTNCDEFVKDIEMPCTVKSASEPLNDLEKNYQHIVGDCTKGVIERTGDKCGVGLVKNHKLNYKVRSFTSHDCYHFQKE